MKISKALEMVKCAALREWESFNEGEEIGPLSQEALAITETLILILKVMEEGEPD